MLLLVLRTHSLLIEEKLTLLRKKERKKDQLKQQTNKTFPQQKLSQGAPLQNRIKKKREKNKPISVCIDQHTLLSRSHHENTGTCNRSTVEKIRSFQHLVNVMDSVFVCYNASKRNCKHMCQSLIFGI